MLRGDLDMNERRAKPRTRVLDHHTVRPFESVVLCVFMPWLTGVARPLLASEEG